MQRYTLIQRLPTTLLSLVLRKDYFDCPKIILHSKLHLIERGKGSLYSRTLLAVPRRLNNCGIITRRQFKRPSPLRADFFSDSPASSKSGTRMTNMPMPEPVGARIRGHSPVQECCSNGLRYWMPECRCPAMLFNLSLWKRRAW
jgi:hypothetical protein